MTETDDGADVVKEIRDLQVPRVDAVENPAHGRPFLILKADDLDPEVELDRLAKAKYSASELRQMAKDGRAFRNPDGTPSYPIGDEADLDNAVHAVGRGGASHDAIRRFIMRRAKQLGASGKIPDNWQSDGSIQKAVEKAMDSADFHEGMEALEDGEADVSPDAAGTLDVTAEGDPDEVCTPAWEAYDAAMARAVTHKLVWIRNAVNGLQERESAEVAAGEGEDVAAVMNLQDVLEAIDFAVGVVGKHAIDEQAEADAMTEEIEEQAEALGIRKSADPLHDASQVILTETWKVQKAGRVLSASNEAALRAARTAIDEVLGRVPAPPAQEEAAVTAPTEAVAKAAQDTEPVEKAEMPSPVGGDDQADHSVDGPGDPTPTEGAPVNAEMPDGWTPGEVEKAGQPTPIGDEGTPPPEPVEKAGGLSVDDLRAMLMKLVKALPDDQVSAAFQAMAAEANPSADSGDAGDAGDDEPEAAPAAAPAAAAPTEPVADAMPAMDTVAKSRDWTFDQLTDALKAAVSPLQERIAKEQGTAAETFTQQLTAALDPIMKRLESLEAQPAPGGPLLNGQVPGGGGPVLRGHASDGGYDAVIKAIEDVDSQGDSHRSTVARGAAAHALMLQMQQGTAPATRWARN